VVAGLFVAAAHVPLARHTDALVHAPSAWQSRSMQLSSAQSIFPSQSSSTPSEQFSSRVVFARQHALARQVPLPAQARPSHEVSAQSTARSQSLSAPSAQLSSGASLCSQAHAPEAVSQVKLVHGHRASSRHSTQRCVTGSQTFVPQSWPPHSGSPQVSPMQTLPAAHTSPESHCWL
jgi:hypothetical protein